MVLKSMNRNKSGKEKTILDLNINSDNIDEQIIKNSEEIKDIYKNPRMIRYHSKRRIIENDLKLIIKYKSINENKIFLKMFENHYYNNKLICHISKDLGLCIPYSANSQEIIYNFNLEEIEKINTKEPFIIKTDTFFFANDKLIIHNKTLFYFSK